MKKTCTDYLFVLLPLLILLSLGCSKKEATCSAPIQPGEWPKTTMTSKPWARWWWMGSAVDKENLSHLLKAYHDAGIGGLEIAPIYGAKGYEHRFLDYLSPEWLDMLHHTISVADSLGMGIDLTQGTGWPFGGPMVTPEIAATRMIVQEYEFKAGKLDRNIQLDPPKNPRFNRNPPSFAYEVAHVMAYGEDGSAQEITSLLQPDGSLAWETSGDWEVLAILQAQTGQLVKRAAPGGEGFTLDHYSKAAVEAYLNHFENAFEGKFPQIRSFYNDSFEVYGADFTKGFFDYFEEKRGYDLKVHLPELLAKEPTESAIRLKSDYRETIHNMLLENFTQQWTDWAHKNGKKTKNQAHGSPGNLLDLYGAVDIPEGETFGSSYFPIPGLRRDSADIRNVDPDPIMLKFASSAAHLTGKPLVSTETFTWLGEHFKSSFSQAKPELEQAFLAGINHMFYHGITYSPQDVPFPGWLFYASINLTTHNSLWPHFKGFNEYISRSQAVLQAGKPSNELLMYWPIYDVWADPKGLSKMITVHNIDDWLHPSSFYKESKRLMEAGFSVDFVSDALLDRLDVSDGDLVAKGGSRSKAILVPALERMPPATLKKLMEFASQGATIIFQQKPAQVPGFLEAAAKLDELDELWESIQLQQVQNNLWLSSIGKGKILVDPTLDEGLTHASIQREELADTGLKFIRRVQGKDAFYYLVNHTAGPVDQWIPLNHSGKSAVLLNPQDGRKGLAETKHEENKWQVRVQIPPGESIVVQVLGEYFKKAEPWPYQNELEETIKLQGPWQITFGAGGPDKPEDRTLTDIHPWTDFPEESYQSFSGLATYETTFSLTQEPGGKVHILDLGDVHESVRVCVNGKEAGYVYGLPSKLNVSGLLKPGENNLKIEVANLMANRMRHLDQKGEIWRNYHEINFVNIDYKPFDASGWDVMPSGLSGPVILEIYR